MRDLVFVLILPFLVHAACKAPFISLGLCVWTTLLFPNGWMYGFAKSIRVNLLFSLCMFGTYFAYKNKKKVHVDGIMLIVAVFLFWGTLTTLFTQGDFDVAWDFWTRVIKIIITLYFVILIIEEKVHFDFLLWCVVLSIGFFGFVEGLKWIGTGGGHHIEGLLGHSLGDRNELSIAFNMTIPICLYLRSQYAAKSKIISMGLLGMVLFLVLSIFGTNSRGGFVSLLSLGFYLFLKSKRKVLVLVLSGTFLGVAGAILSDQWFDRMNTIQSADKDSSFMGRVVAWKLTFIMAMDHPIMGGGLKALEYFPNWQYLTTRFDEYPWFTTGKERPDPKSAHAAHSVYFQLLGNHGFVGLFIYLSMIYSAFAANRKVIKQGRKMGAPPWMMDAAVAMQLSLFVFCVGGLTLSFSYFDMTYVLLALSSVLSSHFFRNFVAEQKKKR